MSANFAALLYLIAAVLSSRHRGSKSPGTHNSDHWVSHTVLGARRGDGFCVHELGATGPGSQVGACQFERARLRFVQVQCAHAGATVQHFGGQVAPAGTQVRTATGQVGRQVRGQQG